MATRRSKASPSSPQSIDEAAAALASMPPVNVAVKSSSGSPFLPTPLETVLLAAYPATLLLGSLFSILSPQNNRIPYSATTQSHPDKIAPSYFARKGNIFNVYFVKVGWFWITGAYFLFLFSHSSLGPPRRLVVTPRRLRAATRYLLVTTVWAAFTQWFFGASIIDRGFRFTGGQCEIIYSDSAAANRAQAQMSDAREALTHAACKVAGGSWKGGHDISGHVFILILGSAMLWLEILPAVVKASGLREERRIAVAGGATESAAVETLDRKEGENMEVPKELGVGVKVALGVAGLSWWMLLMTAAYFHTWFEKFTGLVVAFLAIYLVYFVPRAVPAMRQVIGMPGL